MIPALTRGASMTRPPDPPESPGSSPENAAEPPIDPHGSTAALVIRAQVGDAAAREKLAARYLVALRQWAHGRIPIGARDLVDTDDLVQSALYRAISRIEGFENRGEGAFLAYLRQILLNRIRDEARRARRRPGHLEIPEGLGSKEPSPLEALISRDTLDRYERSLAGLKANQREAVIMRVELGMRHREIAEALGMPSGNAARLLIARGLMRLADAMRQDDD
jgi:RNA polymerase sigma factor (sigma-70 family)